MPGPRASGGGAIVCRYFNNELRRPTFGDTLEKMLIMDSIFSTTFHAVYSDLRTAEFSSKEFAFKARGIFVLEEVFGAVKNGGYSNKEYRYVFYNRQQEAINCIEVDGWNLEIFVGSDGFSQRIIISGTVTDPLGKIEHLGDVGQAFWGVENALMIFKKMVICESIQNYNLMVRVSKLEAEIDEMRSASSKK